MSYIGNEPIVSATRTVTETTATAGQTTFTANGGYTVGYIDVFVNGAQLQTSDFTATNGSTVVLLQAATVGDDVRLVAWGTFSSANAVQKSGDTMTGNLAVPSLQIAGQYTSSQVGMKNRIINGAMTISQRIGTSSVTPVDEQFLTDRWGVRVSQTSKFTAQQDAGAVTPPTGFIDYLGFTSSSAYSSTSTDYFFVYQGIEGLNTADLAWGTANAATVTLSFWVRSSLTGTFSGSLVNGNANRSYPFTYTTNAANTWEYKTITIAGDITGTWNTNNTTGIQLRFNLGSGSTRLGTAGAWAASNLDGATGSVSLVGTSGATLYVTGVQIEKGTQATSFEYRQYTNELALCQRYFAKTYNTNVALGTATNDGSIFGVANGNGNRPIVNWSFPVVMRANPTSATYSPTTGTAGKIRNLDAGVDYDGLVLFSSMSGMNWYPNATPPSNNGISAHVTASAEL
jgi:hypothetical protein